MSRTTKPLPKSNLGSSISLSDVGILSRIVVINVFTDDPMSGVVVGYLEDDGGVYLRRTDEYGNKILLPMAELRNNEYVVKEIDGIEMF